MVPQDSLRCSTGPEFVSQRPCLMPHNGLQLQFQGDLMSLALVVTYIRAQTYPYIQLNLKPTEKGPVTVLPSLP